MMRGVDFDGTRMRRRRKALGLSSYELARLIEEREGQVGRWERGTSAPRPHVIAKIARALDVSSDYLLGLSDQPGGSGRARS